MEHINRSAHVHIDIYFVVKMFPFHFHDLVPERKKFYNYEKNFLEKKNLNLSDIKY